MVHNYSNDFKEDKNSKMKNQQKVGRTMIVDEVLDVEDNSLKAQLSSLLPKVHFKPSDEVIGEILKKATEFKKD